MGGRDAALARRCVPTQGADLPLTPPVNVHIVARHAPGIEAILKRLPTGRASQPGDLADRLRRVSTESTSNLVTPSSMISGTDRFSRR
jgi:hypothetical protein